MVIDSSALLAILLQEQHYEDLIEKILAAPLAIAGAPTLLEIAMVLTTRTKDDTRITLDSFLRRFRIEVTPFTQEHFEVAADAFRRYGKGRHPAALNFGDCMSYAVASLSGFPLLYTGKDFAQTDIPAA